MMLVEVTAVPDDLLPVAALKAHLRLEGIGLSEAQEALLLAHLRAAMAAIEARIAKALLRRNFRLSLNNWRDADAEPLPIAPVVGVGSVTLVDAAGGAALVSSDLYRLVRDQSRPRLVGTGASLPAVPYGGRVEVVFEAGFGAVWTAVPADLQLAVILLAGELHDTRQETGAALLPERVQALIAPWRLVRIIGGGRR